MVKALSSVRAHAARCPNLLSGLGRFVGKGGIC